MGESEAEGSGARTLRGGGLGSELLGPGGVQKIPGLPRRNAGNVPAVCPVPAPIPWALCPTAAPRETPAVWGATQNKPPPPRPRCFHWVMRCLVSPRSVAPPDPPPSGGCAGPRGLFVLREPNSSPGRRSEPPRASRGGCVIGGGWGGEVGMERTDGMEQRNGRPPAMGRAEVSPEPC